MRIMRRLFCLPVSLLCYLLWPALFSLILLILLIPVLSMLHGIHAIIR